MTFPCALRAVRPAFLASVALVTGCAVGPDFERPAQPATPGYTSTPITALPPAGGEAQQRIAVGRDVAPDWWKEFRSPELDSVMELALAGSPTLEAARFNLARARQQVRAAIGGFFPAADLAVDASRARTGTTSGSGPNIENDFSYGPFVSYSPDLWGRVRRTVEQADAFREFQRYQLAAAYLALTGSAISQALNIASIRAQLAQVNELIALDRRNLDLTRASFEGGRSARTDVLAAESQLTSDLTQLPPLNQQLAVARHALSVLVGRAPAQWTPPDFDLDDFTIPEELPLKVPSELVRRRPDILAAEATMHASSAAIGIATANMYPDLTLTGSWARGGAAPAMMFDSWTTVWNIAAGLTQPLFRGGELLATKRAAVEQFNADFATYRDTVLLSFGQVADLLRALEHDAELLEAQRTAMSTAQASLDLIQESYQVGQASLLQVLDAQRLLFQARLGFVRAKAQRLQDTAQLYAAMGGAWESEIDAE
jgi:NodT family efflux transporter outer membrane factor (OMF) lipoprotein